MILLLKKHFLITVDPVIQNNEVIGGIHFLKDITKKKEKEKKMQEENDQLCMELDKFHELIICRELKMMELKKEITKLKT